MQQKQNNVTKNISPCPPELIIAGEGLFQLPYTLLFPPMKGVDMGGFFFGGMLL